MPVPVADLSLAKIVNNGTPNVGSNVTFTVTVSNAGPNTASGVTVGDLLPGGYSYVSSTPSQGSYVSGTGVWTVGTIASGSSANIQITATVLASGTYTNTAQVTASDQTDPDSTPNNSNPAEDDQASVTPVPVAVADLSLAKIVNNGTPNVGSNVTFTVTVSNAGPSNASGVTVGDLLPGGYSYVSSIPSQGSYVSGTGVWTVGAINSGSSANIQITATVLASGTYTNTAQVTASDQFDPNSTPNNNDPAEDDQSSITPVPVPVVDLVIAKTDSVASVNAGGTTTYTVTVMNNGPSTVTNAVLSDPSVAGLTKTGVACSATPGQCVTAPTILQLELADIYPSSVGEWADLPDRVTANVTVLSGSVVNNATIAPPVGYDQPWDKLRDGRRDQP